MVSVGPFQLLSLDLETDDIQFLHQAGKICVGFLISPINMPVYGLAALSVVCVCVLGVTQYEIY